MNGRTYRIEYGATALEELDRITPKQRTQILRKIERLQRGLHGNIKRLRAGETAYRLRIGDYRALFDVERDVIVIRRVGHRREIYD